MIPETMQNIHMVLLAETDADLAKANEHIADLYRLLDKITAFLNENAEAMSLLQEIKAVKR